LLAKSEDKSEAFMLTKRAQNGILVWAMVHNWYMATSGLGISQRMAWVMTPPQSRNDSDVMYDVEKWLDEIRELVALGQPDLPAMYKVTGLKRIATPEIRKQIEIQEQRLRGLHPERVWTDLRDLVLNWSRSIMLDQRTPPASDPNRMDTNNISPSWDQQSWGPPGLHMGGGQNPPWLQPWNDPMAATVKGKGKGLGPGKGFGMWQNGKGPQGFKGFGKGKGKNPEFTTPFRGYCANCHLIGHSSNYCPYLGKGFKGTCKGCGIIGHKEAVCPKGKGKGQNVSNTNSVENGQSGGLDFGTNHSGAGDSQKGELQNPEPQNVPGQSQNHDVGQQNGHWDQNACSQNHDHAWDWQQIQGFGSPNPWQAFVWDGFSQNISVVTKEDMSSTTGITRKPCNADDEKGWKTAGRGRKVINNVNKGRGKGRKDGDDFEWVELEAIMDSGAVETLCGKQHVEEESGIRETEASRAEMNYFAANGSPIRNLGESDVKGESDEGIPVSFTAQVGDGISRILIALRRACEEGNMVVFGADRNALRKLAAAPVIEKNLIMNIKSGIKSEIHDRGGLYTYSIWQKRPVRRVATVEAQNVEKQNEAAWGPF